MIACPDCLAKERKNQLIKNALLGWWGVPWGLFYRTPQAIIGHFKDNANKLVISEAVLNQYITENIGVIKANMANKAKLIENIRRWNKL